MRTFCFEAKGEGFDPVRHFKPGKYLLMTVPRRYFCYGSSMLHVYMVFSNTVT